MSSTESQRAHFADLSEGELLSQSASERGLLSSLLPIGFVFIFLMGWMIAVSFIVYYCAQTFDKLWFFFLAHLLGGLYVLINEQAAYKNAVRSVALHTNLSVTVHGAVVSWRRSKLAHTLILLYELHVMLTVTPPLIGLFLAAISPDRSLVPLLAAAVVVVGSVLFVALNSLRFVTQLLAETAHNQLKIHLNQLQFSKTSWISHHTGTIDLTKVSVNTSLNTLTLSPPQVDFYCDYNDLKEEITKLINAASRASKRMSQPEQPIPEALKQMLTEPQS